MKKILTAILLVALVASAKADPASTQSVERLLDVMQSRKMVDNVLGQMNRMMQSMTDQVATQQHLSPDDLAAMKKEQAKLMAVLQDELSWDRLKATSIQVYSETFTEEEVQGMIGFYQTPAGQSVITKLPTVMQKTMAIMQPQIMASIKKVQGEMQEFVTQLQASHAGKQG